MRFSDRSSTSDGIGGSMQLFKFVFCSWFVTGIIFFNIDVVSGQQASEMKTSGAILWEPVDIPSRDLFRGPTSEGIQPALEKVSFLGRQPGGNNLKYRVKDQNGREWVIKIADESQAEIAAVRLIWAIGYHTEIDHLVPRINIQKIGSYKNVRFEARPDSIKRGERWSWKNNPHI